MTAPIPEQHLEATAQSASREQTGAQTTTRIDSLEPLIRLDARVRRDPEASWTRPPMRRPNTFRLQREDEVQRLMNRAGSDGVSVNATAGGDRRRPTELASLREERRQVIAVSRLICQAAMETLAGVRPVQQLRRWLDPLVYAKVQERSVLLEHTRRLTRGHENPSRETTTPPRLSLRRIRTHSVEAGVWEVSVIFSEETRTRACAMRVEAHRGRWRAVALELG
ncbi:Rv3235 family protein [Nesterenkonia sp. HG001]|uniref:Rv3235 family protein n=1 Tax=Nesterenkonia sp. HG001 TaxID=2983207 RepID=UPI002AC6C950|nr:Rv3235 family protein [Nesterenkonia sp. HG001]MDZ5076250.1 Rv3235 family protein [Nesterenkonia sp. HG001]